MHFIIRCDDTYEIISLFFFLQCFDTPSLYMEQRSDSGVSITSNQNGPPPSYEAVVALDGIRKCSNVNCPLGKTMNIDAFDGDKSGLTIEDMEHDDGVLDNNDKYYEGNKCNLILCERCATTGPNQSNNNLCDCNNLIGDVSTCRNCGEEILDANDNDQQINQNNKCHYNQMTSVPSSATTVSNPNGQILDEMGPVMENVEMLNSVNNNNNLMGDDSNNNNNNNFNGLVTETSDDAIVNDNDNNNNGDVTTENNTVVDLQPFNENGLIRLDMSQIIDSTGLPTYEAALKLEQSGYV